MAFYDDMAVLATDLLTTFGATMTLTRTANEVVDPVTGAVTPGSDTAYTPIGLIKPYKTSDIDGSRILASDRILILDNTIEPMQSDVVVSDSETWNIVSITTVKPDDATDVVHFVQVRK